MNIFKNAYNLIIEKIDSFTEHYVDNYENMDEKDIRLINGIFGSLYLLAPNYKINTFSENLGQFINQSKFAYSIYLKSSKKERVKTILSIVIIACILILIEITIITGHVTNYAFRLDKLWLVLPQFALLVLLYLIFISIIEKKSLLKIVKEQKEDFVEKYIPNNFEVMQSDKQIYANIKCHFLKFIIKSSIFSLSSLIVVLLVKYVYFFDITTKFILCYIAIFGAFFLGLNINGKLLFNIYEMLSLYKPSHIKYRVYRIIFVILTRAFIVGNLLVCMLYLKIL